MTELDNAVASLTLRLAGDIGDNVRLVGTLLAQSLALAGNVPRTLQEDAAEIRAPAGSLAGVTSFQIRFGADGGATPVGRLDLLVVFNPAALKIHLADLNKGGLLLVNADTFRSLDLTRAGYLVDPLSDGSLAGYRMLTLSLTALTRAAVAAVRVSQQEADRYTRFYVLGLLSRLIGLRVDAMLEWIADRFEANREASAAATLALRGGFGHSTTLASIAAPSPARSLPVGRYRLITGGEALVLGLIAAARRADLPLVFASHPSGAAVELLRRMAGLVGRGIRCFQAEDEAAAASAAVGASYGGAFGVTATSGSGLSLQSEALSLAVMAELPLVIIDVQRVGPSTGLAKRTEQADLLLALHGRQGECPAVVLAATSPADCFTRAFEAIRLAAAHMTPVVLLVDTFVMSMAEPWRVPDLAELPEVSRPTVLEQNAAGFEPYRRDSNLVRPWVVPGTPGCEHRLGGQEKEDISGRVSHAPTDHEHMVRTRAQKVALVEVPALEVEGPATGALLVVGWGSTDGAIALAVAQARQKERRVAHAQLRHLQPMPANLGAVLRSYSKVLVAELNAGQLLQILRATFLVDAVGLNKVQGEPLHAADVADKIEELLEGK